MAYRVSWMAPGRVILARMYGVITLDEITQSNEAYMELLKDGEGMVHTIADLSKIEKFPLNLPQIMKAMKIDRERETGWMVIIQKPNPVLQYIAAMMAQIAVKQIRFRTTTGIPSAIQFLLEQDQSLNPGAFNMDWLTQQEASS